jgi:hypothetical protein
VTQARRNVVIEQEQHSREGSSRRPRYRNARLTAAGRRTVVVRAQAVRASLTRRLSSGSDGGGRAGPELSRDSLPRQPERASLRVLADRPRLPRVNHAAAEGLDSLQRLDDIGYREVGQ